MLYFHCRGGGNLNQKKEIYVTSARSKQILAACVFALFAGGFNGCSNSLTGNSAVQINPSTAVLFPGQTLQFNVVANVPNVPQFVWEVNGVVGGSASTGTITTNGVYTAPKTPTAQTIQVGVRSQPAQAQVLIFNSGQPTSGTVAQTQNPLVATYAIPAPMGASVAVQFGTDTTYGQSTSNVFAPPAGGNVTVLVAGMRASTTYHMQALINLSDGSQAMDTDHTFTTGSIPASQLPNITTQLSAGGTPSPGVELLSLTQGESANVLCAVVTDLGGNVIWYYPLPEGVFPEPIKLLPNGHMLLVTAGSENDFREVDLAGNIITDVTTQQITASVANIPAFQGAVWEGLNHDILALPNGHRVLLASIQRTIENVSGVTPGTVVLGNALIDWDPQKGAVWTWSTFDHLDLTYAPNGLADWTHGNALIYSPDDGNLIFSMRNLNWVVKINYNNGVGDGSILWHLGPNGDFTLPPGQAPIEWNYGQHYPTIQSANSTGVFSLMFFNNGNNRLVDSNNDQCGSPGVVACYSSVPIFQLDEDNMAANVLWEYNLTPAYSDCCGDALVLPNGNVEFDVAMNIHTPNLSYIEEVTQPGQLVWRMNITGNLAYRGFRIPSLYPGVTWPANTQAYARSGPAQKRVFSGPKL
jgi:arylsulfate sulfotransferase